MGVASQITSAVYRDTGQWDGIQFEESLGPEVEIDGHNVIWVSGRCLNREGGDEAIWMGLRALFGQNCSVRVEGWS